jgi:hypothetical protein
MSFRPLGRLIVARVIVIPTEVKESLALLFPLPRLAR